MMVEHTHQYSMKLHGNKPHGRERFAGPSCLSPTHNSHLLRMEIQQLPQIGFHKRIDFWIKSIRRGTACIGGFLKFYLSLNREPAGRAFGSY